MDLEPREVCDSENLGGETCVSQGFDGGELVCGFECNYLDTSGCFVCGDDVIGGKEVCDGADLGGQDCASLGFGGGMLACAADCSGYDTAGCSP